jgi:hypothetical protein
MAAYRLQLWCRHVRCLFSCSSTFMGSRERRKCIYGVKDLEAHIAQTSNGTAFTIPVK